MVEVIAAQMGITGRGFNFEDAITQFQNGNIEGPAAKVVNENGLVIGLINAISKGSRRRFVDDSLDIKTSNTAGVLRSLTLGVVEVSRYSNDRFRDFFAEITFRVPLHFFKDHSGNLFWRIVLAINGHGILRAHVTFDGADGPFRVGNSLTFCQLTNEAFPIFCETDNGRSKAAAFLGRNNSRFAAFHHGDNRVRSP